MARVVVTGGAGFIGSQLVRSLIEIGHEVCVLDLLTYAGNPKNLWGVPHEFVHGNVCDPVIVEATLKGADIVIHAAAESHVCRAHQDPFLFTRTNIEGTRVVLEQACRLGIGQFIHVSTDEVFGAARSNEASGVNSPFRPGNAYAASKVGAEAMVSAWRHTHDYPAVIVRCTNNYGPRQHPEKAIPFWTLAALSGRPIPYDGDGSAQRDWLHVQDFASGVCLALETWRPGATWHFAGGQIRPNLEMVHAIGRRCQESRTVQRKERQGQDAVYRLDDRETRNELGWRPRVSLENGLDQVVDWYRKHPNYWS